MNFIQKLIPGKKVLIIDVGTYKVRTAFCEYKNGEILLLGYGEKRQDQNNIIGSEIANIEGICYTVEISIKKALENQNSNPKDIIINIPTSTIISSGNKINYLRDKKDENIEIDELDFIIGKIEKQAINQAKKNISKKTGYQEVDIKLITSSITDINIDGFKVSNPIGFSGKNINVSTLNIFIIASRYNLIQTIGNYLQKNILSIIPLEFSLPKILEKSDYIYDDIIFIDIGNTKTSIIIQKSGVILGFDKIDIGINDLIKNIKNNYTKTSIEIIENISKEDKYLKEKEEFLSVFEEGFIIALKEFVNFGVIPHKLFFSGGGSYDFIQEYIKKIDLGKYVLHSLKPLIIINNNEINKNIKISQNIDISQKEHIGLLSMIITTKDIINYKKNPVLQILKNFLDKNEF